MAKRFRFKPHPNPFLQAALELGIANQGKYGPFLRGLEGITPGQLVQIDTLLQEDLTGVREITAEDLGGKTEYLHSRHRDPRMGLPPAPSTSKPRVIVGPTAPVTLSTRLGAAPPTDDPYRAITRTTISGRLAAQGTSAISGGRRGYSTVNPASYRARDPFATLRPMPQNMRDFPPMLGDELVRVPAARTGRLPTRREYELFTDVPKPRITPGRPRGPLTGEQLTFGPYLRGLQGEQYLQEHGQPRALALNPREAAAARQEFAKQGRTSFRSLQGQLNQTISARQQYPVKVRLDSKIKAPVFKWMDVEKIKKQKLFREGHLRPILEEVVIPQLRTVPNAGGAKAMYTAEMQRVLAAYIDEVHNVAHTTDPALWHGGKKTAVYSKAIRRVYESMAGMHPNAVLGELAGRPASWWKSHGFNPREITKMFAERPTGPSPGVLGALTRAAKAPRGSLLAGAKPHHFIKRGFGIWLPLLALFLGAGAVLKGAPSQRNTNAA
jgi:hypothetical protein